MLGGSDCWEGGVTKKSANETRLAAAGPAGQATAGVAGAPEPGSLPRRGGLPGMVSTAVHAFKLLTVTILSRVLTQMVKERGARWMMG